MNTTKILLFATLRDYTGESSIKIETPAGMTVAGLKALLIRTYPRLAAVQGSMMAAVNREYASDDQVLPANAEIAFFPPVSGG